MMQAPAGTFLSRSHAILCEADVMVIISLKPSGVTGMLVQGAVYAYWRGIAGACVASNEGTRSRFVDRCIA